MVSEVGKKASVVEGRARWAALVVLCFAQFMLTVDDTIVNIALPSIRSGLGFTVSGLAWVADGYWLMFGGFLLLGGRMADLLGKRRLFLAGVIVFATASLADGLAQAPATLVVARGIQGLGAAMVSPAALALITVTFPKPGERARALGVWGGIAGAGGAIGVVLGGTITTLLSWRWIFLINVPIGVAVLAALPLVVPADRPGRRAGFDVAGAVSVTAGLLALVYAMLGTSRSDLSAPVVAALLAAGVALLVVFVRNELRSPSPLVPLSFFRERVTCVADVLALVTPSAFAGMFFLLTLSLQTLNGYSPLRTGVAYLPLIAAMFVAVPLASGALVPRVGVGPVLTAGLAMMAIGLLTLVRLPAEVAYWRDVLPALILVGFGAGWAFIPLTIAAVARALPEQAGLASGVVSAAMQVGGAVALAVYVLVATHRTQAALRTGVGGASASVSGDHLAFLVGAAIAGAGALVAAVGLRGVQPQDAARSSMAVRP